MRQSPMPGFRAAVALVALAGVVTAGAIRSTVAAQQPSAGSPEIVLDDEPTGVTRDQLRLVSFDCRPEALAPDLARVCRVARRLEGQRLFDEETFGGNGRTCLTCHSRETGTFSASDAQSRLAAEPDRPALSPRRI